MGTHEQRARLILALVPFPSTLTPTFVSVLKPKTGQKTEGCVRTERAQASGIENEYRVRWWWLHQRNNQHTSQEQKEGTDASQGQKRQAHVYTIIHHCVHKQTDTPFSVAAHYSYRDTSNKHTKPS